MGIELTTDQRVTRLEDAFRAFVLSHFVGDVKVMLNNPTHRPQGEVVNEFVEAIARERQ